MLKCWRLHNQYRQFISDDLDFLSEADLLRLQDMVCIFQSIGTPFSRQRCKGSGSLA